MPMSENEKIEARQFRKIVAFFIIGPSIIVLPSMVATEAKQDAWISAIVGWIAGIMLAWLYSKLGRLFPGMSIVQFSRIAIGRWSGTLLSVLLFAYSCILTSFVLRHLGDFMVSSMFPETPIQAIHIVYLCIVAAGARYGIANIARTLDIFYPFVLLLFGLFIVMLGPKYEFGNLLPVLGEGFDPVLSAAYPYGGFPFMDMVLFLMIFPKVRSPKEAEKAFISGTLLGGGVLFLITLMCILVMGAENTASNIYASFELAKKIQIGEFLQRVEGIMALIWFITIFFKLTVCFYFSVSILAQTFNLRDHRPLVFPMGMLFYALSIIIAPNIAYYIDFNMNVRPTYAFTFGFVIPLLLLAAALAGKKRKSLPQ